MAIFKKKFQMNKKYSNGDTDILYPVNRPKDIQVNDTTTLEPYITKVDGIAEGATKTEKSSTNGNVKINGSETQVYKHPTSGTTPGSYNKVTVDANGHVTAGTNETDWSGSVSGDESNGTVSFTTASARSNLSTGDKLSIAFGKIAKWYTDLKALAWLDKVGTAQLDSTLLDEYNKRVTTDNVTTSTSITESGWVADARTIASLKNSIDSVSSDLDTIVEETAPTNHATTLNKYGLGTTEKYGHVMVINNLSTTSYEDGKALSAYQGYQLDTNKAPKKNPTLTFSGLKCADGTSTVDVEFRRSGNTPEYIGLVINKSDGTKVYNNILSADGDFLPTAAPKSHASSASTYGKGTSSQYGHLKISDNYTSSAGAASDGVAASSKALNDAYKNLANADNSLLDIMSNNLGRAANATDLRAAGGVGMFYQWLDSTDGNPYSAGITDCSCGFAVVYGDSIDGYTILASGQGPNDNHIYIGTSADGSSDITWDKGANMSDLNEVSTELRNLINTKAPKENPVLKFTGLQCSDGTTVDYEFRKAGSTLQSLSFAKSNSDGTTTFYTLLSADGDFLPTAAPKSHASSASTYGKGTSSQYGHLKISDNYTSSAGAASDGVAASSQAVANLYSFANKFTGSKVDIIHGTKATTKFINFSFTSGNGYLSGFITCYSACVYFSVSLDNLTTSLTSTYCIYKVLYGTTFKQITAVKNTDGSFRIKFEFTEAPNALDITCFVGNINNMSIAYATS